MNKIKDVNYGEIDGVIKKQQALELREHAHLSLVRVEKEIKYASFIIAQTIQRSAYSISKINMHKRMQKNGSNVNNPLTNPKAKIHELKTWD